jgi:predicted dehydrogenase
VLGLGLLGQITVQMLKAAGAVVIGVDVRPERVARAQAQGLDAGFTVAERDFVAGVVERTGGRGADAVVVTAAGGDAGLLNKAFEACRRKGRVVLVGDVPIRIQRDKIYKKEIDFLISTSYGPGRYDPAYEEKGQDYPFGYVRWTEGRNLEEVLRLIAAGTLRVKPLVDATHGIQDAGAAYASLAAENRPIGILLDYHLDATTAAPRLLSYRSTRRAAAPKPAGTFGVGVVGYGGYFRSMLLPLLKAHPGFRLASACSRSGLSVRAAVENDAFTKGTTDYRELVADPEVDVVYVATRHDLHYAVARAAVDAGKAVFVEKPMTMTVADARSLCDAVAAKGTLLTVGFNRRFSPHAARLKVLLAPIAAPKTLAYRVNAGALPPEHWLLDPTEGGGRLLGEGVHFFDLLCFLAGAEPVRVLAASPRGRARDEGAVSIEFADGSIGSLVYASGGASASGKERLEVFAGGASFVLDDYRSLVVHGLGKPGLETRTIEKGQSEQLENFYRALRGEASLGVTAEDGLQATWCAEMAIRPAP